MLTLGVHGKMLSSLVNIYMRKDWREIVLLISEIEDLVCIVPEERTGTKKGNLLGKQVSFIHWLIYSYNKYLFSINKYLFSTVANFRRCQGHNGVQDGFSFRLHGVRIYWKIQTIKQAVIRQCDKYCDGKHRVLFCLYIKHISNISSVKKMVTGEYSDPGGMQEEGVGDIVEVVTTITIKILFKVLFLF